MNYLIAIKTAIFIFPIIAFLITIPFMLHNYHKYGSIHWFKTLITYTFILYLIIIFFLVILPLPTFEEALKIKGPYFNLVPFNFVRDFFRETSLVFSEPSTYLKALKEPCVYVVAFNIFMTIPFGVYLHYYFKYDFKKTLIYSLMLSLFFEFTQGTALYFIYPNPYRLCDIDDLILNTLGGIIGFFVGSLFMKYLPSRDKIDEEAYILGKKVSGLRRITVFFLDIIIYLITTCLISITGINHVFLIGFIVYYLIIPIIIKNQTLGMRFLNVKMEYSNKPIINNILRYIFLMFYYFYLPFYILLGTLFVINTYNLTSIKVYLVIISCLTIMIFYIINVLIILIKKRIYYDKFFRFKYISTIEYNQES